MADGAAGAAETSSATGTWTAAGRVAGRAVAPVTGRRRGTGASIGAGAFGAAFLGTAETAAGTTPIGAGGLAAGAGFLPVPGGDFKRTLRMRSAI